MAIFHGGVEGPGSSVRGSALRSADKGRPFGGGLCRSMLTHGKRGSRVVGMAKKILDEDALLAELEAASAKAAAEQAKRYAEMTEEERAAERRAIGTRGRKNWSNGA